MDKKKQKIINVFIRFFGFDDKKNHSLILCSYFFFLGVVINNNFLLSLERHCHFEFEGPTKKMFFDSLPWLISYN